MECRIGINILYPYSLMFVFADQRMRADNIKRIANKVCPTGISGSLFTYILRYSTVLPYHRITYITG